jgi:catecholate siderophore receptor
MQEAVRNVPGVSVHLGEGRRDQILIRGFNALNDQFVDGFRDDSPYYRDLSNVDRIEVVKGPASVLYGRGSSGGIVNRITKSPVPEGVLAEIATMGGSYGTKRLAMDFGMPFFREQLTFRITGAAEDSGTFRHDTGVSRYALSPSLLWQPSDRTQFVFQSDNLYDDRIPDRGIPSFNGSPASVDKATYYGDPSSDYLRNKVYGQSLRIEHRTDRWNLRNNFRHSYYDNDFSNTQPNNVVMTDAGPMVTRQQYNVNSDQSNYFNQTEASTSAHFLVKHTILLGAEYGFQTRDSVRYTGTAADVALVNPVLPPSVFGTTPATNNIFDGTTAALYVQDLLQFGQKWKAMVGGRFDYFKQTLWDRSPAQANLGRIDRQFSPRAGLVYQPHTYVSLYGNFSRSFQPSGEALSLAANAAELKPETTENYEVGGKFDLLGGRMDTTLSVFRLDRNNVKTTDPANPSKLLPIGVQRTDGFEISVSGRVINRLEVYGGYAWLDATIVKSNSVSTGVALQGKRAALVPKNSFNLWSTYTFENGFGFGGGIYYNDVRYAETNNLVVLPSYTRVDGTLFYRKRHYDVAVNIRNLGNTDYYESAHANYQIMPGAPINGTITTRFRW